MTCEIHRCLSLNNVHVLVGSKECPDLQWNEKVQNLAEDFPYTDCILYVVFMTGIYIYIHTIYIYRIFSSQLVDQIIDQHHRS